MAEENSQKLRLDVRLAKEFKLPSRSAAQSLIKEGKVKVNKKETRHSSQIVSINDHISVDKGYHARSDKELEIEVLYEDDDCVVINKPAGVLSHSKGSFNPEPTVASWLAERVGIEKDIATNRDGIVHRLDRSTSGVMICAKNSESLTWLQKQFSTRKVVKTYLALVEGEIEPKEAIIDMPIERNPKKPQSFRVGANGKSAITKYETTEYVELSEKIFTLLRLIPKTGRTHQLRVHLKYLRHPIVGDDFYDGLQADRLYLHATSLKITLPSSKTMTFSVKMPNEFLNPNLT